MKLAVVDARDIYAGKAQERRVEETQLEPLIHSMVQNNACFVPLVLMEDHEGRLRLVCGYRRWLAAKEAANSNEELAMVPALIYEQDADGYSELSSVTELLLVVDENRLTRPLHPIEQARRIVELHTRMNYGALAAAMSDTLGQDFELEPEAAQFGELNLQGWEEAYAKLVAEAEAAGVSTAPPNTVSNNEFCTYTGIAENALRLARRWAKVPDGTAAWLAASKLSPDYQLAILDAPDHQQADLLYLVERVREANVPLVAVQACARVLFNGEGRAAPQAVLGHAVRLLAEQTARGENMNKEQLLNLMHADRQSQQGQPRNPARDNRPNQQGQPRNPARDNRPNQPGQPRNHNDQPAGAGNNERSQRPNQAQARQPRPDNQPPHNGGGNTPHAKTNSAGRS